MHTNPLLSVKQGYSVSGEGRKKRGLLQKSQCPYVPLSRHFFSFAWRDALPGDELGATQVRAPAATLARIAGRTGGIQKLDEAVFPSFEPE